MATVLITGCRSANPPVIFLRPRPTLERAGPPGQDQGQFVTSLAAALDPGKIPQELKVPLQWVLWKSEKRDGKPTKIPYCPQDPKRKAEADNPATWGSYEKALTISITDGFAGIGFEFSADDPYTGIDLDKCRNAETGEIEPWARAIIDRMATYTEISPSGTGMHILIKGKLPPGGKRKGKIEMYDSARYFTMTGDHLAGTPLTIEPRQAELEVLHGEVFGKPKGEPQAAASTSTGGGADIGSGLSDDELIDRIKKSKNGKKFDLLMSSSDLEDLQFRYLLPSQSEVDLSLCSILAWWTGKNPEQMDRIFRRSALMRPKWDEYRGTQSYGQWTIAKAIAGTTEGWRGPRQRRKRKTAPAGGEAHQDQTVNSHIERLNRSHAIAMIGGKCVVLNEIKDHNGGKDITFSSVYDLKNYEANQRIWMATAKGPRSVGVSQLWLESPDRRQYPGGVVFSPGKETPGAYNLWRGFAVIPAPGDWSLFREHTFNNICAGNEVLFNYLLDWMARNVQDPGGERPGVAVVLKSEDFGTGKGVFATQYGMLFGPHFQHITNGMQLLGKFNNHLKDCLFCFVDEGVWGGDKQAAGVLKGLITERVMMIEPKGINAFPVENHLNLIIASNNDWVVPAGLDERRYLVLEVSPKRKQDTKYFGAIVAQMDKGGREAMLYDLLERKITVDLRKVPKTAALLEQVVNSMTTVQKFWFERLRGVDEWPKEYVLKKHIFEEYHNFAKRCGDGYPIIPQQLGKALKVLCPGIRSGRLTHTQGRERVYFLPKLDVCRKIFEEAVGVKVDWGTEDLVVDDDEDLRCPQK